jgi:hypothetical protein
MTTKAETTDAAWVGGWPSLTLKFAPKLLKEFGINLSRILATNPSKSGAHLELGDVELLIICTEIVSHRACDRIVSQAKKRNIPIIYGSKSWSKTQERLVAAGYSLVGKPQSSSTSSEAETKNSSKKPPLDLETRHTVLLGILALNPYLSNREVLTEASKDIQAFYPSFSTSIPNKHTAIAKARKALGIKKGDANHGVKIDRELFFNTCETIGYTRTAAEGLLSPTLDNDLWDSVAKEAEEEPEGFEEPETEEEPSDNALISALELLQEEMKKREYIKLVITGDGSVSFEKRVYRPVIESGEIQLGAKNETKTS